MRCFIAIDVPEELREYLVKIQGQLNSVPMDAKFVEKENFHLTLKFLGEISDIQIGKIKEKLEKIKFKSFRASFEELGCFPSNDYIRVIWISLEPEGEMRKLNKLINDRLESSDERFGSHVTLARVRMIKEKKALQEKLREIKIEGEGFEVSGFKLKKSSLTNKGPVYDTLKTFEF